MPLIGLDLIYQCAVEGCSAVARARVAPGGFTPHPDFLGILRQLHEEGFELDGGDWVCWNHGERKKRGAPAPAPVLQGEKE